MINIPSPDKALLKALTDAGVSVATHTDQPQVDTTKKPKACKRRKRKTPKYSSYCVKQSDGWSAESYIGTLIGLAFFAGIAWLAIIQ